jgi:hypothetical protein
VTRWVFVTAIVVSLVSLAELLDARLAHAQGVGCMSWGNCVAGAPFAMDLVWSTGRDCPGSRRMRLRDARRRDGTLPRVALVVRHLSPARDHGVPRGCDREPWTVPAHDHRRGTLPVSDLRAERVHGGSRRTRLPHARALLHGRGTALVERRRLRRGRARERAGSWRSDVHREPARLADRRGSRDVHARPVRAIARGWPVLRQRLGGPGGRRMHRRCAVGVRHLLPGGRGLPARAGRRRSLRAPPG